MQWCDAVHVVIHTKTGDHQEIGLFVVPHICNLLTTQSIATSSKTYVHLAHLKLADESQDGRLQVDMLIGSDLYWQFVTGETIWARQGPVAVGITLGWILCYFNTVSTGDCSLYGFCDASTAAYAAVVYLVAETSSHRSSSFVAAKTRVVPLAQLTIPRLELLSALLLAQLITTVSRSLSTRVELMEPKCFMDSKIAYFWIKSTGRDWRPFVQNRVNEIHRLTLPSCWDHCCGKENPADIPTRGMTPLELSLNPMWRSGPTWLRTETNRPIESSA